MIIVWSFFAVLVVLGLMVVVADPTIKLFRKIRKEVEKLDQYVQQVARDPEQGALQPRWFIKEHPEDDHDYGTFREMDGYYKGWEGPWGRR